MVSLQKGKQCIKIVRSYGVLLWEIASYGVLPLESCKVQEVVEMAEQKTLMHPWLVIVKASLELKYLFSYLPTKRILVMLSTIHINSSQQ